MLLSLRYDHKQHLQMLIEQPQQVLVDFCILAIDFLHNGSNNKLCDTAANKLHLSVESIQNCINGLVNLLILSCKHNLTDIDFKDSVLTLGFSTEQLNILLEFYKSKYKEISEVLKKLVFPEPHYHDLDWRFEVQISSRSLSHQVIPLVTMELVLKECSVSDKECDYKHTLLQTDPLNLLNIADELEKALFESRTRYSRRIQRTFVE